MMDHPDIAARFVENYEPTSAFGTKALGEPPACPVRTRNTQRHSRREQAWRLTGFPLRRMSSLPGSKRKGCFKERGMRNVRHQSIV